MNEDTLYYKRSSDFEKGKKGIETVIVTTEAQLVEAGVDKEVAKTLMHNLIKGKNDRILVVKDENDKAVRVFRGSYVAGFAYDEKDNEGKVIKNEKGEVKQGYAEPRITIFDTVDLSDPKKTVGMDRLITLSNVNRDGHELEKKHVDVIQKAIENNQIGKAPERNPAMDELLERGPSGKAQYAMGAQQTPVSEMLINKTLEV